MVNTFYNTTYINILMIGTSYYILNKYFTISTIKYNNKKCSIDNK